MAGIVTEITKFISYREKQERRFNSAIEKGIKKCGVMIQRDAKIMAPHDTGRLSASISMSWTGSGNGEVGSKAEAGDGVSPPADREFTVKVGTRVDYASYQEHGTSKMPNHPFLFPAYEMNIGKLPQLIKGEVVEKSVIG